MRVEAHPAGSLGQFMKNLDREKDCLGFLILGSLGASVGVDW